MSIAVRRWLAGLYLLIIAMVVVGGATRLTGSGLSMVEWHPFMGAVPPLNAADWHDVFAQYQTSPQFAQVNQWMQLADFKRIFLWEYAHRLLGRIIGLAALLPWLYFLWRRRMSTAVARDSGIAILLGGAQGLLGWFMVKSGLVDRPEVSHFRLAAHFLLAVLVAQWILWILLRAYRAETRPLRRMRREHKRHGVRLLGGAVGLWLVQGLYGAFMAGTRAGLLFNTFPSMNGRFGPGSFRYGSLLADLLHHPPMIHWVHRALALVFVCFIVGLCWWLYRRAVALGALLSGVLALTLLQILLGALTVVLDVPIFIAVAHQVVAVILLSTLLALLEWLAKAPRRE